MPPLETSQTAPMPMESGWIHDVTLGSELTDEGRISLGESEEEFDAGNKIYVAMQVGDAPEAATVSVRWKGPAELPLSEESKQVNTGEDYLHFEMPELQAPGPGDYQVEVWADEEMVTQESFRIGEDRA